MFWSGLAFDTALCEKQVGSQISCTNHFKYLIRIIIPHLHQNLISRLKYDMPHAVAGRWDKNMLLLESAHLKRRLKSHKPMRERPSKITYA